MLALISRNGKFSVRIQRTIVTTYPVYNVSTVITYFFPRYWFHVMENSRSGYNVLSSQRTFSASLGVRYNATRLYGFCRPTSSDKCWPTKVVSCSRGFLLPSSLCPCHITWRRANQSQPSSLQVPAKETNWAMTVSWSWRHDIHAIGLVHLIHKDTPLADLIGDQDTLHWNKVSDWLLNRPIRRVIVCNWFCGDMSMMIGVFSWDPQFVN